MNHRSALLLAGLFALLTARGQYDTLLFGQFEAISNGPFETPFPTGSAATSRTQYVFHASELMGVLPADSSVAGLVIQVLDNDPLATVDLYIQMKNTVTTSMVDLELTGLQATGDTTGVVIMAGWLGVLFDQALFQWIGSMNVLVEYGMRRTSPPGFSPRVALDTSFTFTPTYYAQDPMLMPIPSLTSLNATDHGPFGARPVIGFLIQSFTNGISPAMDLQVALFPNPAVDHVRLAVPGATDDLTLQIHSPTGALVHEAQLLAGSEGPIDVALPPLVAGCHLMKLIDHNGHARWVQRLAVER